MKSSKMSKFLSEHQLVGIAELNKSWIQPFIRERIGEKVKRCVKGVSFLGIWSNKNV